MHSYHTGRLYFRLRYRFRIKSSENRLAVICKRLDCTVELNVTMKRTPALFVALILRKQTHQSSHFNSIDLIEYRHIYTAFYSISDTWIKLKSPWN